MSKVVEYLEEHGPCTYEELPYDPSIHDKKNGMAAFSPELGGRGPAKSVGGQSSTILYLLDKHGKAEVINRWLEENKDLVEKKSRTAVRNRLRKQGRSWHGTIDRILPPSGSRDNRGGIPKKRKCPICEKLVMITATHIAKEHDVEEL